MNTQTPGEQTGHIPFTQMQTFQYIGLMVWLKRVWTAYIYAKEIR
jgi:hypothetical protein